VNPGFDAEGVLTFSAPARGDDGERAAFQQRMRERLAAIPGVESASAATPVPLDGSVVNARWGTAEAEQNPDLFQQANVHIVLPGYLETMKTPLLAGRTFTDADNNFESTAVIIDDVLARKAFGDRPAVGERLLIRVRTPEPEWLDVVGVVKQQRHTTLAAEGRESIFFTDGQLGHGVSASWFVRTSGDPLALMPDVRATVAAIDPRVAIDQAQPMKTYVDQASAQTRFALVLISVFAGIAALLATVGLYGVLSTVVRQRTPEIGVRVAFGAEPGSILRLIVGQGLRLSGVGIALGVVAALLLTRVLSSLLVGVQPTDPATYAVVVLLFVTVAAVASWLPAQRAARLDPTTALRKD
jgi:putative ABC transport system permease protein